jgi:dTDP-glucose pyrophosphorylase
MNVVIPMAGRGSRFADRGVPTPKPLIPVAGRPMVAWAVETLADLPDVEITFVSLREHEERHGVTRLLRSLAGPRARVILLDDVTEGQLVTVLAAREFIDTDDELLIASADTYVLSDLGAAIARRHPVCRGLISVIDMPGDRWSFARADASGRVVEVAEKVRISDHASTGLYHFASGREFVEVAQGILRRGERTRGEYYVMPVYQHYIDRGWHVEIVPSREMWDMGTPEALAQFESRTALHRERVGGGELR